MPNRVSDFFFLLFLARHARTHIQTQRVCCSLFPLSSLTDGQSDRQKKIERQREGGKGWGPGVDRKKEVCEGRREDTNK